MCAPAALAAAAPYLIAATAVAGGYAAYSSYQQGKFQQKVANNNAEVANQMATQAIERGQRDEMRHRLKVAHMKSDQRAAFGASGRDISGSALDILGDTAMMGELDALTIRYNAQLEGYGQEVQAENFKAQGKLDRQAGNAQAAGTLLETAGNVGSQWYNYKAPTPASTRSPKSGP